MSNVYKWIRNEWIKCITWTVQPGFSHWYLGLPRGLCLKQMVWVYLSFKELKCEKALEKHTFSQLIMGLSLPWSINYISLQCFCLFISMTWVGFFCLFFLSFLEKEKKRKKGERSVIARHYNLKTFLIESKTLD